MKPVGLFLLVLFVWSSEISAQTPYYQGKTIRLVVGYPAGSAHDIWTRLVAPQLTKHIPDNHATIVQVMIGAGSMTTAYSVYNMRKPERLTLRVVNGS